MPTGNDGILNPEEFEIILATSTEQYEIFKLKDLFPMGFGPGNLA